MRTASLIAPVFAVGIALPVSAEEAPRVGGTLVTLGGGVYHFEYIGTLEGRIHDWKIVGSLNGDHRSVSLADLREVTVERSGGTYVAHLKGLTGAELRLESDRRVIRRQTSRGNAGSLDLVVIDPLTGKRKILPVSAERVASIQLRNVGRFRWNPRTRKFYPSWYDFDPIDGSQLSWTDDSPPSPGQAPATTPPQSDAPTNGQQDTGLLRWDRSTGSLLADVGNLIEGRTGSSLEQQYRGGTKWLALFGVETMGFAEVNLYVDLADYFGITAEGRGDGPNQGEEWVTVWVEGAAGLGVSLLPVSFGVVKVSFDPGAADPSRRYRLSLGRGALPGFSVTAIEKGAGDGREWGRVSFGVLDASVDLADIAMSITRFEIGKSVLRGIIEEGFSNKPDSFSSADIADAAMRVVGALVSRDETTDEIRVVADGVRPFTSSDDGPAA